jgi:peptidyl-dipeptidase Dcp
LPVKRCIFDNASDLEGLSANDLAAKIKATEAGHEGQYLIGLQNTTQQPIQNLTNRATREKNSKRLGLGSKK